MTGLGLSEKRLGEFSKPCPALGGCKSPVVGAGTEERGEGSSLEYFFGVRGGGEGSIFIWVSLIIGGLVSLKNWFEVCSLGVMKPCAPGPL